MELKRGRNENISSHSFKYDEKLKKEIEKIIYMDENEKKILNYRDKKYI